MDHRWLLRSRCLTPYRFLLFAFLYGLACIVCMTVLFDSGGSTQLDAGKGKRPVRTPSQGPAKKPGDVQSSSNRTSESGNWRDEMLKELFRKKRGLELALEDYQTLLGNKSIQLQCNQCAIVSSSGQLLGTGAGEEIDHNDCVFRMNNAPTKGFEADVGRRTTVRVIGHVNLRKIFADKPMAQFEFLLNESTRAERIFVHWTFLTEIDKDPPAEYALGIKLAKTFPNVSFNMFTPQKMKYAEKIFQHETGLTRSQAKTWLSTGWYTVLLAIDSCKKINVYGMIHDNYCKEHPDEKIPYHYYDRRFKSECKYYHVSEVRLTSGHLFITEKAVFGRWASIHNIHFRYPQWPPGRLLPGSNSLLTPFVQRYQIAQNRLFSTLPAWKLFFHFAGLFYPLVH